MSGHNPVCIGSGQLIVMAPGGQIVKAPGSIE